MTPDLDRFLFQDSGRHSCAACPCPETCLRWPVFCAWAAEEPPDETRIRHIRTRSAMGPSPATKPPLAGAVPSPAAEPARPEVAQSLALLEAMKACAFRAVAPGCGCSAARCALRGGAPVSHPDCFDCVRRYDGGQGEPRDAESEAG